jgi:hypothetical protein
VFFTFCCKHEHLMLLYMLWTACYPI